MKSRTSDLNKISKIICISNDYLNHRKNLTLVKGLVDHSSSKRNSDVTDLLNRKATYRELYQIQAKRQLNDQNEKIVERLSNLNDRRNSESRSSVRSTVSAAKSLSERTLANKTKLNFMKAKQLKIQNKKMSMRVSRSHFKDSLSPEKFKSKEKQRKQYMEIRSKSSSRSQAQMQSLLKNIKASKEQVPFLPLLPSSRYARR